MIVRIVRPGARPTFIGLAVVLGFLLHDVGMTATVHAAPLVAESSMADSANGHGRGGVGSHGAVADVVAKANDPPRAPGAVVTGRKHPKRGAARPVDDPAPLRDADVGTGAIDGPTRSPAVQRALVQVYRI